MQEIVYMEQNKKKDIKNGIKSFIEEFKDFIRRGNVLDLAVAVIVGNAFSKIVNSLVNDIIMPLIGILIGGIDFTKISVTLKDATISYGNFIQNIVNFLIIAFVIFLTVKFVNGLLKKKEKDDKVEKKEEVKVKTEEVILLEEIRDLLKK